MTLLGYAFIVITALLLLSTLTMVLTDRIRAQPAVEASFAIVISGSFLALLCFVLGDV